MSEQFKIINGKSCVSSALMQEMFGVSRQALGNWAKSGCPKAQPGWWPLVEVVQWRGLNTKVAGSDEELSDEARKRKYEAEIKRLQADQLELKNAIAHGEYLPRTDVIQEIGQFATELKRSMSGLSRKLTTEIAPFLDVSSARRVESDLNDLVNDAMERIATGEIYEPPKRRIIKK